MVIIIDPSFKDIKAECVYNKLNNLSSNFAEAIQKFAGETPGYNWKVMDGDLPGGVNGRTSQHYDTETGIVVTTFDTDKFSQATDLAVARTMLHEAVHANVVATFYNTSTYEERKQLLGSNWTYSAFGNGGHGFMVDNYINSIANALQEFGKTQGYNLSSQFYHDLAWGGLTHYRDSNGNYKLAEWFKNEVPNSSDRNRIIDNILIEQTGKDNYGNNKNQKGTDSSC